MTCCVSETVSVRSNYFSKSWKYVSTVSLSNHVRLVTFRTACICVSSTLYRSNNNFFIHTGPIDYATCCFLCFHLTSLEYCYVSFEPTGHVFHYVSLIEIVKIAKPINILQPYFSVFKSMPSKDWWLDTGLDLSMAHSSCEPCN